VDARDKRGHDERSEERRLRRYVSHRRAREKPMTKPLSKAIKPVPEENQSHKGPGSAPSVPIDTTKGHRDDEKHNIREQVAHGNLMQNTSNKRSG
jgi:hypothetical protein